jgi:hypothetical protein
MNGEQKIGSVTSIVRTTLRKFPVVAITGEFETREPALVNW